MSRNEPIRIFVGGCAEHWLPTKVLEYSILRRTHRQFEFGRLWDCPLECPIPIDPDNRPATSFSLQRFLIPELCNFEGKGIYLDSDMIVWGDISELWETPFQNGTKVLAPPGWQSAVMLWDCTYQVKVAELVTEMDSGKRTYSQLMKLKGLEGVSRTIDPNWNCMDRPDLKGMISPGSRLLHYTDMKHQPWLKAGHPAEEVWVRELKAALRAGHITREDILREVNLRNVRPSLALLVGAEPSGSDEKFVFPNDRRVSS
jgi:hypothetical protein